MNTLPPPQVIKAFNAFNKASLEVERIKNIVEPIHDKVMEEFKPCVDGTSAIIEKWKDAWETDELTFQKMVDRIEQMIHAHPDLPEVKKGYCPLLVAEKDESDAIYNFIKSFETWDFFVKSVGGKFDADAIYRKPAKRKEFLGVVIQMFEYLKNMK